MCSRKEYFQILKLKEYGLVFFDDNKSFKVNEIGTLILEIYDDHECLLHNMRRVLDLKQKKIHKYV